MGRRPRPKRRRRPVLIEDGGLAISGSSAEDVANLHGVPYPVSRRQKVDTFTAAVRRVPSAIPSPSSSGSEDEDSVSRRRHDAHTTPTSTTTSLSDGGGGGDAKPEAPAIEGIARVEKGPRFADLGGMEAVIEQLMMEVVVPLCHPELPQRLGVRPVAGLLLHGPPGCGKTTLAHAIANETGVPFYKISAPEGLLRKTSGACFRRHIGLLQLFS